MAEPLILVTNDDGIASPGLLAAAEAVADLGELLVVAPALQQTGMSRGAPVVVDGLVVRSVLRLNGREVAGYAVPGSPAQAVMYGILALSRTRGRRPALVLSGINYGENVGSTTTASGTVGAALEGAAYGIPALAVSLETPKSYHYVHGEGVDWQLAGWIARSFARAVLAGPLPPDVDALKIDIPSGANRATPWRVTRQSRQPYYETFPIHEAADLELGHFDYRVSVDRETLEPDSDIYAFAVDRAIAVTPLSIDLTSRTDFGALDELLRGRSG